MIDLTGKTILLTGSSSGIGAATARVLGAAGATLIAHYAGDKAGAEDATSDIPAEVTLPRFELPVLSWVFRSNA